MEHFLKSSENLESSFEVVDTTYEHPYRDNRRPIGRIIVTRDGRIQNNLTLCIKGVDDPTKVKSEYNLSGSKLFAMMSPCPDPSMKSRRQRDVIYISAPSGSGKSTWAGQYARAWQDEFKSGHAAPKPPASDGMDRVIIFSAVNEDPAFEGVNLKRVLFAHLVDSFGEPNDCITIENLSDSLVIFDDIDVIANKKLRLWIQELRNRCLEIGRHHNISLICTTHQLMNYKETKILLMEATKVVFFPTSGAGAQIKRYLKAYADLSQQQIKHVFSLKSRWVMINKANPQYIMHANGAYLL